MYGIVGAKILGAFGLALCASAFALPPSWNENNSGSANTPETRNGPNPTYSSAPHPPHLALHLGRPEDSGGSLSGNYNLSIPLFSYPGRGMNLGLSLEYSSQKWTKLDMLAFDVDGGWPSAGWSLGFGKLLIFFDPGHRPKSGLMINADKSREFLRFNNDSGSFVWKLNVVGNSLSLVQLNKAGTVANVTDGRGRTVRYVNNSPGAAVGILYPTQISDPNGNFIEIAYVSIAGVPQPPAIDTIKDTVGRIIKFHYDFAGHVVSVTGPSLETDDRVIARFTYSPRDINLQLCDVPFCRQFSARDEGLSGIIFPGTAQAYWIGTSFDYGLSDGYLQTAGVTFKDNGVDKEPTEIVNGVLLSETLYDYPIDAPGMSRPPEYKSKTVKWLDPLSGQRNSASTTHSRSANANDIVITVTLPDGSMTNQFVAVAGDAARGIVPGQIRRVENIDVSGVVLSSTDF